MLNGGYRRNGRSTGLIALIIVLCLIVVLLVVSIFITAKKNKEKNGGPVILNSETAAPGNASASAQPADATPTPKKTPEDYKLVAYTGRIEHVFTHSLVAFPELAYKNVTASNFASNTYYVDCVTVKEFKAMLEAFYKDGYMLINLNDFYESFTASDGSTQYQIKKNFMFPEGKKPLVFSFDDTNYYANKQGNGMVDKLILQNGKIVTYTKMKDGQEVVSDDNEFIPIIDNFVDEHPDFSFNGAKGMICLTGFDGILGYRTQRISEGDGRTEAARQSEIEAVKPIVQKLKDTGWYFACHSYKHGVMANYGEASMRDDAQKFRSEVTPLIGTTKIYVYPYGSWRKGENSQIPAAQAVLNEYGFTYFCSVGVNWFTRTASASNAWKTMNFQGVLFQDRANLDGTSFLINQEKFSTYHDLGTPRFPSLNFADIYDNARGISYADAVAAYKKLKGIS